MALAGQLSVSIGWKNGPELDLRLLPLTLKLN